MHDSAKKIVGQDYFVMMLLALIWGSSFILMNKGLFASDKSLLYTPLQMAALRITIAAAVMSPLLYSAVKAIPLRLWPWIAVVGVVGSGIPAALFSSAQQHIDSSLAGILNSLTPFFTMLISVFALHKPVSVRQKWGICVGLIGAVLLVSVRGFDGESSVWHALLIVLATFFYGISVTTIGHHLIGVKSFYISALSLAITAIPYGIYLFCFSDFMSVYRHCPEGPQGLGYITLLAVASTAIASFLFFRLTQRTGALFSSSVTYLMPIVAVGWGLFFNEKITWMHGVCGLIILAGVYLVSRTKTTH
jgi:drug/metabolite transporter (DMT)-like permease